jgi:hypothetical protein
MERALVHAAYRKLKSYVYYDTSNLWLRKQVAEFELSDNVDLRLHELHEHLQAREPNDGYWKHLISEVTSRKTVKQFEVVESPTSKLITNKRVDESWAVTRVTHFIDAPLELHILSCLWLLTVGYRLERLMKTVPYGNKIELEGQDGEEKPVAGLKFFKPYFTQYKKWRDAAVKAAKDLVDRDKNALIIGLDVQNYYHSVRIDLGDTTRAAFDGAIPEEFAVLSAAFKQLHLHYSSLFIGTTSESGRVILPIGLMSSCVLANYYLRTLDDEVQTKLRPDFYGRYVDDILIVTSCADGQDASSADKIAEEFLVESGIFRHDPESQAYVFARDEYEGIRIQGEKLSILHFVSSEPTALLDRFVADIRRNSSEWRWLPEDEDVDYDFDEAAYSLNYQGTGNKLRDIQGFSEDKFGVSKFLAKKIFLALQFGHELDEEAVSKVTRFFKGRRAIDLSSQWERVFVFLLVNDVPHRMPELAGELFHAIESIEKVDHWNAGDDAWYLSHLLYSLCMALALRPSILDDPSFFPRLYTELGQVVWTEEDLQRAVAAIRHSNMVRHLYVVHPLLNYVEPVGGLYVDLVANRRYFEVSKEPLAIDHRQYRYSPRFVHFHEVTLFHLINRISTSKSKFQQSGFHFAGRPMRRHRDYLDEAYDDYFRLNYERMPSIDPSVPEYARLKEQLFKLSEASEDNDWTRSVRLEDKDHGSRIRVGVVNMNLPPEATEHAYLRNPRIRGTRRREFNALLNDAEKERVDILVMPEVSVPVAWFKWIADYARVKQRCLVFGLEHWIVGKRAFNFLICMMPIRVNGFNSLVINIRLKNHYSPEECEILEGYGYIVPEPKRPSYDLISWQGCHFAAFNCFELSNIEHRARFRSKVDILTVSEFNKDTNYFSSIVESATRDLHCYVVQVNDAKYGDSRVCQPARSVERDLVKVKGGLNSTVLVADCNLGALREFQLKEYSGQKRLGTFKPTPPDFDRRSVIDRMKS